MSRAQGPLPPQDARPLPAPRRCSVGRDRPESSRASTVVGGRGGGAAAAHVRARPGARPAARWWEGRAWRGGAWRGCEAPHHRGGCGRGSLGGVGRARAGSPGDTAGPCPAGRRPEQTHALHGCTARPGPGGPGTGPGQSGPARGSGSSLCARLAPAHAAARRPGARGGGPGQACLRAAAPGTPGRAPDLQGGGTGWAWGWGGHRAPGLGGTGREAHPTPRCSSHEGPRRKGLGGPGLEVAVGVEDQASALCRWALGRKGLSAATLCGGGLRDPWGSIPGRGHMPSRAQAGAQPSSSGTYWRGTRGTHPAPQRVRLHNKWVPWKAVPVGAHLWHSLGLTPPAGHSHPPAPGRVPTPGPLAAGRPTPSRIGAWESSRVCCEASATERSLPSAPKPSGDWPGPRSGPPPSWWVVGGGGAEPPGCSAPAPGMREAADLGRQDPGDKVRSG